MVWGKGQARNWLTIAPLPAGSKTRERQKQMNNKLNNKDNNSTFRYLCRSKELPPSKSRQFFISNEKGTKIEIAVFNIDGKYYSISNTCQHQGGPLSKGILDIEKKIVTCPWHGWKYSVIDGKAPHKGGDSVNSYETKMVNDELYVNPIPTNIGKRISQPHEAYSNLENSVKEYLNHTDKNSRLQVSVGGDADRTIKVLGISTTNSNDKIAPRKSTSEAALRYALDYAKNQSGTETMMIKLRDLSFKHCEGYYSKNAKACIFPCSISEMDKEDQMIEIYEKIILWADVVLLSTPIRWG